MSGFLLFALAVAVAEAANPMLIPLYRSTGLSRTTRINWLNGHPAYDKGWADEIYTCHMALGNVDNWRNLTVDFGWAPTFMTGDDSFQTSTQPMRLITKQCASAKIRGDFGPKRSSTFQRTGVSYGFSFESPYVSECGKFPMVGEIVEDWAKIGSEKIAALPMVLMPADTVGSVLHPSWYSDGILGLGLWHGFFGDSTYSFILKVLENMPKKLVTVYINNQNSAMDTTVKAGAITFGDADHQNCQTGQWRKITPSWTNGWSMVVDSFSFGRFTSPPRSGVGVLAFVSAYIYAPPQIRTVIVQQTGAKYDKFSDQYYLPCSKRQRLPAMIFNLQGYKYRVGPEHYVRKIVGVANRYGDCLLMVGESTRADTWYLGSVFHRPQCVMFDYAHRMMYFAPKKAQG